MENNRLAALSTAQKTAIVIYLLLLSIAFTGSALMSYDKYHLDHHEAVIYYQGEGGEDAINLPKPYGHLLAALHVHAYTMPIVFMSLWVLFSLSACTQKFQISIIGLSALSIILYNAAPWLTRYGNARYAILFTIGGIGMFASFFLLSSFILLNLRKAK